MKKNKKEIKDKVVAAKPAGRRLLRRQNISQLLISLAIIIMLNIAGSYVFTRFDLTSEKRYTLSDATRKFISGIDDIVYFRVYLEGDFPAGFKRLRMETKEMLDEFRAYNSNIQYKFINPSEGKDPKAVRELYKQLMNKGLEPTNLQVKTTDGTSQQIIFPGAIVSYRGREMPLQLLMSQQGSAPERVLNNSIQGLEYNIANVIRKLTTVTKPRLAFIEGHGELDDKRLADIMFSLSEYYSVERVKIDGKIHSLALRDTVKHKFINKYKAIVIAKPDSAFSEKDKFFIDQYIMRGGKVLWLIDPVFASMDSLQYSSETMGINRPLNLEDMLFKYGVRINYNLIMDLNALPIPIVTGQFGGQPQQEFLPWYFFPLVTPSSDHPIVKNLNAIKFEFVSSLDTVGNKDIHKTILLTTSQYSRTMTTPVYLSLNSLRQQPDQRLFNKAHRPVAALLEGSFQSVFKNRLPPEITQDKVNFDYRENGVPTAMIVISDGDVIKNQLHYSKGYPLPLGYDQFTNQTFGNKDFIMNCIDYLCDESGLIAVRSREVKLRMLDKTKVTAYKLQLQILNTALPVVIVILFGIILSLLRKRRNTSAKSSN